MYKMFKKIRSRVIRCIRVLHKLTCMKLFTSRSSYVHEFLNGTWGQASIINHVISRWVLATRLYTVLYTRLWVINLAVTVSRYKSINTTAIFHRYTHRRHGAKSEKSWGEESSWKKIGRIFFPWGQNMKSAWFSHSTPVLRYICDDCAFGKLPILNLSICVNFRWWRLSPTSLS